MICLDFQDFTGGCAISNYICQTFLYPFYWHNALLFYFCIMNSRIFSYLVTDITGYQSLDGVHKNAKVSIIYVCNGMFRIDCLFSLFLDI